MWRTALLYAATTITMILVALDALSVFFLLLNPEGYWDGAKLDGKEALHKLLPVFAAPLAAETAALHLLRRSGTALAAPLLTLAAALHYYAGLHICADCQMSPGETVEAVLAALLVSAHMVSRGV
ncbi:hypothetical protein Pyrde_1846 [Pyrodictium delaneyi]|uniref:Uncharacterized protein n=1 Tax=Pyrodictium delaneyi TaxID=1273541 RepID=A0A0N7JDD5_9CREN|nr:hypothetical protein [Pyrodictium delaneyi]ALL01889.1 hypothetical protein Pyrde_1846 [Pyrodictium delaneyi]OWJ54909.1 hypothetical protein Pdsh_04175 [Pyrodictium delaneyi]